MKRIGFWMGRWCFRLHVMNNFFRCKMTTIKYTLSVKCIRLFRREELCKNFVVKPLAVWSEPASLWTSFVKELTVWFTWGWISSKHEVNVKISTEISLEVPFPYIRGPESINWVFRSIWVRNTAWNLRLIFVYLVLIWPCISLVGHSLTSFHLIKEWLPENLLTTIKMSGSSGLPQKLRGKSGGRVKELYMLTFLGETESAAKTM